jgi:hypothetical protein
MSTDRDVTRIVRSWLEEGATALPDRVLDAVLDQVPATSQRRSWWPARRFSEMNSALKVAMAALAVVAVAIVGTNLLQRSGGVGGTGPSPTANPTQTPAPTPSPVASPTDSNVPATLPESPLEAGTYTVAPFSGAGEGMCHAPPQPGCTETAADDTIRFTITIPDGWSGVGSGIWLTGPGNGPPDGAALLFSRGAWLLSDPCKYIAADIPVGPTVADFVDAVANHPTLDTTTPVDVTLAGYSGKSFDLQVPADISNCQPEPFGGTDPIYRPWEPGIYAQGPSQRWHQRVLDVGGVRVVVQTFDYAGTPATRRAELQAIVDSIKIQP